jgi:hypothetical protein
MRRMVEGGTVIRAAPPGPLRYAPSPASGGGMGRGWMRGSRPRMMQMVGACFSPLPSRERGVRDERSEIRAG